MSAANNGGPAFPDSVAVGPAGDLYGSTGMSLRDAAAIQAMAACVSGHITHFGHDNHWPPVDVAQYAYELADAMLAERAK
jgi:hypothetical protein